MSNILLFLILLAAVAMPLWIARCRRRGTRWMLPWLATLLPLGALLLISSLDLLPSGLDRYIATQLLFAMVLPSMAAFSGGALFLAFPMLRRAAKMVIVGAYMVVETYASRRRHEDRRDDDKEPIVDITDAMDQAYDSVGFPVGSDDYDWDNNKYY